MQRTIVWITVTILCLFVQTLRVSSVSAEEKDVTTQAAAGLSGALTLVIGVPLKAAACGATAVLGGVGYGLTLGHSEFIQQEVFTGLPALCGARFESVPIQVNGPQPSELIK